MPHCTYHQSTDALEKCGARYVMKSDLSSLMRLESFPFRHRLSEVMAFPVVTAGPGMSVAAAAALMTRSRVSSVVVVGDDGLAQGLVSERDVLRSLVERGPSVLDVAVATVMVAPVQTLPADALFYRAIARMTRLALRHLVVVDRGGRPVGIVTSRALLQARASRALMIGDALAEANSAADLGSARQALPALARGLRADGTSAREVAAVIGAVLCDITARAAELVEAAMAADGWGAAPAPWALLALGSAGRGESLLAFDQDNALVYSGSETSDRWFEAFGQRLNELLDAAGIPLCKGGVMVGNGAWRRTLEGWQAEIRRWVHEPAVRTTMNADIFFDFQPVFGDHALAEELRRAALRTAGQSAFFLQFLATHVSRMETPLTWFSVRRGRLDIKKYGLLPLVSAARARAIRAGIEATGTAARYAALTAAQRLHADDLAQLNDALEAFLSAILDQQLVDLAAGKPATTLVDVRRLPRPARRRLADAIRRIRVLKTLIAGVAA